MWSECGGYHAVTIGREKVAAVTKSLPFGKASIADGIPPAAENGRTRAPFESQVKFRSHERPNIHIGRAVPAEISGNQSSDR